MSTTLVSVLPSHIGEEVTLQLQLEIIRSQKHLIFLIGKDKSATIQVVVSRKEVEGSEDVAQLLTGSIVQVTGTVVSAAQSKTFGIEIQAKSVEVLSAAQAFPIAHDSSLDLRLKHRVVDLKSAKGQLMLKVRSAFEQSCREYFYQQGLTEIHTPKLMGTASESGSQVFKVKYFDTWAYLAQSPQFYKQMAIATGLSSVFEIGPIFRAEESRSSRHLTEFTGLDVEMAGVTETVEIMKFEQGMLEFAFSRLAPFAEDVKKLFEVELPLAPSVQYLSLAEAKILLAAKGLTIGEGQDLPDEGEKMLWEITGKDLIFVYDYPVGKRPFYHKWDRPCGTTKSFDLIFKGIEITTGAIREHDLATVSQQAAEKGVSLEGIEDYLACFKYGCPPHGGFGLGIERVIVKLLGLGSVKEAAFVARDPERLTP